MVNYYIPVVFFLINELNQLYSITFPINLIFFVAVGDDPHLVPQCREYVTRNAICVRMQGQSTIEEHTVKEDDTDIDEILRKLATSHAKKKKKPSTDV